MRFPSLPHRGALVAAAALLSASALPANGYANGSSAAFEAEFPQLGLRVESASLPPDGKRQYPRVVAVRRGGPAFVAGVHPGDWITRVGRSAVKTAEDFQKAVAAKKYARGDTLTLNVLYRVSGDAHMAELNIGMRVGEPAEGEWDVRSPKDDRPPQEPPKMRIPEPEKPQVPDLPNLPPAAPPTVPAPGSSAPALAAP